MYKNSWLEQMIIDEGWEINPYKDSKGNLTGGCGHLFTYEDKRDFKANWSEEEKTIYWLKRFADDVRVAIVQAREDFGHLPLTNIQMGALAELKFNMGNYRFSKNKWPKFYKAMEDGNYKEAEYQLLHNGRGGPSKWLLDIKGRARRIAYRVRG